MLRTEPVRWNILFLIRTFSILELVAVALLQLGVSNRWGLIHSSIALASSREAMSQASL